MCLTRGGQQRLDAESKTLVPVAFSIMPMNSGKDYKAREVDVAQPLMAAGPVGGNQGGDFIAQPVVFDTTQITSAANFSNPKAGDPCHPLAAGAHPPAIAFHPTQDPISSVGVCHAIGTGSGQGCATAAVAFDTYNQSVNSHTSQTIKSPQGAVQESVGTVLQAMQVRRLTPTECERLQGFPDGYTQIPWRKKPATECPDGPRYKALGNSWAVPVARWIGDRINKVSKIIDHTKK
jgi:DNA (cytosine-5)-methyltransferase 1